MQVTKRKNVGKQKSREVKRPKTEAAVIEETDGGLRAVL
jgi:hypothetical protein